jgi:uncharacterized protein (UPF0261 family)
MLGCGIICTAPSSASIPNSPWPPARWTPISVPSSLVPLVQAKLPRDFRVIQGHRCIAGGRQYTHLIISGGAGGGKLVSLVLTRKLPSESLSGGIYQAGVDRFQVVGFQSHDYLAYVISDLDASQNLQLEAALAPVVREYLAAHATG